METNEKRLQEITGRNLRRYRTEAKLTQKQVAERAGISTAYYASLERGKCAMSVMVLRSLADALNVSADCLLYEESRNTHIQNVHHLLRGKSDETVIAAENIVTVLLEHFTAKDERKDSEE